MVGKERRHGKWRETRNAIRLSVSYPWHFGVNRKVANFWCCWKEGFFYIQMRIFCNIQIRLFWKLMNAKGCRHRKKNPSFNNCQNYYPSLHSFWATLSSMSVHPFVPQQSCLLYDISSFSFSMIFSSLSFSVVLLLLRWPNILLLFLLLPWNTFLLKMFCSFLYFIFLFRWPNIFLLQIIFPFLFFSGQTFTSFLFFLITFSRLKTKNLRYLDQN